MSRMAGPGDDALVKMEVPAHLADEEEPLNYVTYTGPVGLDGVWVHCLAEGYSVPFNRVVEIEWKPAQKSERST